jgi:predicted ferric reductase
MGWVNLALIAVMGFIYPLKLIYQKGKDKRVLALYKRVRVFHPIMGGVIIALGLIHGYMSLGALRLHTGSLIVIALMLMAAVSLLGPRVQFLKRRWRDIHRYMGLSLWVLIFLHLFYRSLI